MERREKKEAVSIVEGKVGKPALLLLFTIRSTKLQNLNLLIAWRAVAIYHYRCKAISSSWLRHPGARGLKRGIVITNPLNKKVIYISFSSWVSESHMSVCVWADAEKLAQQLDRSGPHRKYSQLLFCTLLKEWFWSVFEGRWQRLRVASTINSDNIWCDNINQLFVGAFTSV